MPESLFLEYFAHDPINDEKLISVFSKTFILFFSLKWPASKFWNNILVGLLSLWQISTPEAYNQWKNIFGKTNFLDKKKDEVVDYIFYSIIHRSYSKKNFYPAPHSQCWLYSWGQRSNNAWKMVHSVSSPKGVKMKMFPKQIVII